MRDDAPIAFDVDDLPLDVFELADRGVEVETLTAGHGLADMSASTSSGDGTGCGRSSSSCSCKS